MARKTLGRGLSALLGESTTTVEAEAPAQSSSAAPAREIDVTRIKPNPEQPRTRFEDKALNDLADSIAANGIVQPIVVRSTGDDSYQIVAGERRWRAAQRAGLKKVPVVFKEIEDDKVLEIALIENIQRQDLNPIEEAAAYRKLIDSIGLTQEQVSERVGKERSLIATSLRLLKLPPEVQQLVEEGKLSAGHGRALLLTEDKAIQIRMARAIIEKQMSVREAERTIKRESERSSVSVAKKAVSVAVDPNFKAAETKMMRSLGTNVKIRPAADGKTGKIEIEYYSTDDLDRLYNLLNTVKDPGAAAS